MPMFEIIYGDKTSPKEEWQRWGDELYTDPQEANRLAKEQSQRYTWNVFMIRRLTGERDFASRENARTDYKPFEVQGQTYHFAELNGEMISFFPTIAKAEDNQRSEIKLGRYLRQYTDLSDNEIAEICARNGVECRDMELKFARTRDEIAEVYRTGPGSCMKSPRSYWPGDVHPSEAYASPDIAVAYIVRDDRITARAVCTPDKKQYVHIYGDGTRMQAAFEKEGFTQNWDCLDGARFLKIHTGEGDRYAMPYIDSDIWIADSDDPQYFIGSKEKGSSTGEHGYVDDNYTGQGRVVEYDGDEDDEDDCW